MPLSNDQGFGLLRSIYIHRISCRILFSTRVTERLLYMYISCTNKECKYQNMYPDWPTIFIYIHVYTMYMLFTSQHEWVLSNVSSGNNASPLSKYSQTPPPPRPKKLVCCRYNYAPKPSAATAITLSSLLAWTGVFFWCIDLIRRHEDTRMACSIMIDGGVLTGSDTPDCLFVGHKVTRDNFKGSRDANQHDGN